MHIRFLIELQLQSIDETINVEALCKRSFYVHRVFALKSSIV